jgi:hypothetical protein
MKKKLSINSLLKLIILYICSTRIETDLILQNITHKNNKDIVQEDPFKYQQKLLEKKLNLDNMYSYKSIQNTNEKLIVYMDVEGKWIGYKKKNYYKNPIETLRLLRKDNERLLNTTLFGSVKLY